MRITHKNLPFEVEPVKYCKMLNGVKIYVFRVLKQQVIDGRFIVAVKRDSDILFFMHFTDLKCAIWYYLDLVCQYA